MLPQIITGSALKPFKFFLDDHLNEGALYNGKLYQLVQGFEIEHRGKAYAIACSLTTRNYRIIISCHETQYKVWVDLFSYSSAIVTVNRSAAIAASSV